MREVELHREVNEAMDHYHRLYREKYGVAPIISNAGEANTILRDLIRTVGLARTRQLLTQYMKMDGDNAWFARQGHSLPVLKKNLEQVNAATGAGQSRPSTAIVMKIPLSCDKCGQYFDWIGTSEQLERTRLCSNCKGK